MKSTHLIIVLALFVFGCREKYKITPVEPEAPAPVITHDTGLKCTALPPTPEPFGWKDSTGDNSKNIKAFIYNPINANEIICVVNGDITGYNQLFNYNIVTKQKTYLANLGDFLPSVNHKGWIAYSNVDNNLFIIKCNGDSLKQLTTSKTCQDPKWDYTGNYILYFQQAYLATVSSLVKIAVNGNPNLFSMPVDLPHHASFRKSDQIIFYRTVNSSITLIHRNMATQGERTLISATYNPKSGRLPFENLCLDNTDENFYWSNPSGIFKCNLSTLKIDTLLKNCPNYTYSNILMSFKNNELLMGMHIQKPLNADVLLHIYKAMEFDLGSKTLTEIRIFP